MLCLQISENGLLVAVDDPLDDLWKPAYAEPHVLSTLDQSTGALFAAWWADMRTENTSEVSLYIGRILENTTLKNI